MFTGFMCSQKIYCLNYKLYVVNNIIISLVCSFYNIVILFRLIQHVVIMSIDTYYLDIGISKIKYRIKLVEKVPFICSSTFNTFLFTNADLEIAHHINKNKKYKQIDKT